jgi:hypothetical protein
MGMIGTVWQHGKRESTLSLTKVFRRPTSQSNFFAIGEIRRRSFKAVES